MRKLIYGVGVNDVDYVVQRWEIVGYDEDGQRKRKRVWACPYYFRWRSMLERCYSRRCQEDKPSYVDCSVCDEWKYLSKFKSWMEQQDWEGKHLDKDILVAGNRIYSPNTCCFVLPTTNAFVSSGSNTLTGASYSTSHDKFLSTIRNPFTKETEVLGYFLSEHQAHEAWRKRKHELAQLVADMEPNGKAANALRVRYSVPHSGIAP